MRRIKVYVKESIEELVYKISWPTWQELQASAMIVIIASMLIAIFVYIMDITANVTLNRFLYRLFE